MERYQNFIQNVIKEEAKEAGSLRKLGEKINVKHENLSKVLKGNYVPSEKTFEKWFPKYSVYTEKMVVFSRTKD